MSDRDPVLAELNAERARKEKLLAELEQVTGIKHEFDDDGNLVEVGRDWHIDKYGTALGFNEVERNEIKKSFDEICQSYFLWAGAVPSSPKDYSPRRNHSSLISCSRAGDPEGFLGTAFRVVRWVYFRLEFVPLFNSKKLWYLIDKAVLGKSESPLASEYLIRFSRFVSR